MIGGRVIRGERVEVMPGTEILLAGCVPLPWAQVYAMLPTHGARPFDRETNYHLQPTSRSHDGGDIGIGWGILAFLFPLAGWIMYFVWKSETPKRAKQAAYIAWIGFGINVLISIISHV